jgi:hypothetical protein
MAGERSVMTAGGCEMQMSFVVSWGTMGQGPPLKEHGMVKGGGLFSWMTWGAMDRRPTSGVAPAVVGHRTIAAMGKTPVLSVINTWTE